MKTLSTSKSMARTLRVQRDQLNGVIHSRNLYVCLPEGKRRVYCAEIVSGRLTVEDLYSGSKYDVSGNKFEDGYGKEVIL